MVHQRKHMKEERMEFELEEMEYMSLVFLKI